MFWWRDTVTGPGGRVVDVAFTDTGGGERTASRAGLNLGGRVGDDPGRVRRNRARVAAAVGVAPDRFVLMDQVHGRTVHVVTAAQPEPAGPCDGIVTSSAGLALGVLVADCTPILLVDAHAGVIGAVHAGRPGLVAGVVDEALDRMQDLGGGSPVAIVGPSVCARCYEVPAAMREDAARVAPASRAVSWTGTPAIDVAAGVVEQLRARRVDVSWVPGCTREEERLFSYRADRSAGRQAGVVLIRESARHG